MLRAYVPLRPEQRAQFRRAAALLRDGLRTEQFSPSFRIKRYRREAGVWELTWAPDGRAMFRYGDEHAPGSPHIIWLRIGSHDIFRNP